MVKYSNLNVVVAAVGPFYYCWLWLRCYSSLLSQGSTQAEMSSWDSKGSREKIRAALRVSSSFVVRRLKFAAVAGRKQFESLYLSFSYRFPCPLFGVL